MRAHRIHAVSSHFPSLDSALNYLLHLYIYETRRGNIINIKSQILHFHFYTWFQNDQHKSALKIGQAKSADGEPSMSHVCNGRGGNASMATGEKASSVDEAASSQSSSIDREESVDRFDESSSSRLNKVWSQCSVLVETDISKCGVLEEADISARHNVARRNTLAAPPAAYRWVVVEIGY